LLVTIHLPSPPNQFEIGCLRTRIDIKSVVFVPAPIGKQCHRRKSTTPMKGINRGLSAPISSSHFHLPSSISQPATSISRLRTSIANIRSIISSTRVTTKHESQYRLCPPIPPRFGRCPPHSSKPGQFTRLQRRAGRPCLG
jgi:hypothetical protein